MNFLTDVFPELIGVDGIVYTVNFDYKTCLSIIMAFEDGNLVMREKLGIMLSLLYDEVPQNVEIAVEKGIRFLNCNREPKENEEIDRIEPEITPRYYSFSKDAGLIYAAFRQTHNIDLSNTSLHWWAFSALFMDLGSDTAFCQLVALRKRVITGKGSKEDRALAVELGDLFYIEQPETRTPEQVQEANDFDERVREATARREILQNQLQNSEAL